MLKKLYLVAYNRPKLVARLLEASHFVSDAMRIRMVQLQYAGRRTRLPGRTSQHGEIAQDGVPYYCPQGLQ